MAETTRKQKPPTNQPRTPSVAPAPVTVHPLGTWLLRAALPAVCSAILLTLSFEPFNWAWLAWVALVPWLLAVSSRRSLKAAFLTGMIGGLAFFAFNVWWLWTATVPGTIALVIYFSLYWGLAGVLLRGLNVLRGACTSRNALESLLLIPIVWTAAESLRAYIIPGFPWLWLGYSQTSLTALCQIADVTGTPGVTFLIALVNALVALAVVLRGTPRILTAPALVTAAAVLLVTGYGVWRLGQDCTYPGPSVMVVQSHHPHLRGGTPTVSREEAAKFTLATTRHALISQSADLVLWPETAMPPLNPEVRSELAASRTGPFLVEIHRQIGELAADAGVTIVAGANYVGGWVSQDGARFGTDLRNSVYCYTPDGEQSAARYDKLALVPFAETVAFKSVPWLHRIMMWLSPPVAAQELVPGDLEATPVFTLTASTPAGLQSSSASQPDDGARSVAGVRFITPICLENISPPHVAHLLRSEVPGRKRAEFILNLSNDGWFHRQERWQHWQNVLMRCIENRVPMARSSNTGISGFVDSCGRTFEVIPPDQAGTRVFTLPLDRRVSPYSRFGEWFALACVVLTTFAVGRVIFRSLRRRRT